MEHIDHEQISDSPGSKWKLLSIHDQVDPFAASHQISANYVAIEFLEVAAP